MAKRGRAVIAAGLLAGTLDISDALIVSHAHGVPADRIYRLIASGVLGPQWAAQAAWAAPLGVALHFGIALGWTTIFYLLARRVLAMRRHPYAAGCLYGLGVWMAMNWVVVPLSRVPPLRSPHGWALVNSVLAVALGIGLGSAVFLRALGALPRRSADATLPMRTDGQRTISIP